MSLSNVGVLDLLWPEYLSLHFGEQEVPVEAIPTPFPSWNKHCRDDGGGVGLGLGWHSTVAAGTGSGKTLMGLNMAATELQRGGTVGFLSLEMTLQQLGTRLYAIITETPVNLIERGARYDTSQKEQVCRKLTELREETGARFYACDDSINHPEEVLRYLGELVDKGCRMIVIDYLQLLAARDSETLFSSVSNVSAYVREFARTERIVTVGLSQLNRTTSANYKDRPIVQGLMGASSLENDSDQVLLLDHSRFERDGDLARTWAILGKNRHGSTGEIPILWNYETLRVREGMPDEEHEWPTHKKRGKG